MACHKPYVCSYWAYCTRELPKPNVFDLINMHFDKKLSRYYAGAVSFEELWKSKFYHNPIQLRQIDCTLHHCGDVVIVEEIRKFVSTLKYPLYFLDFETVQYAVPRYIGSKPYEQIPLPVLPCTISSARRGASSSGVPCGGGHRSAKSHRGGPLPRYPEGRMRHRV